MNPITPYICVSPAARALEFYQKAFGAKEVMRLAEPDGKIGHAELEIAGGLIMLSDEYPDYGCRSPKPGEGSTVSIHLTVPNVDEFVDRAAKAGATVSRPPKDEFYGMRSATLTDPFGHRWIVGTEKEKLTVQEVEKRYTALMQEAKK
jgi:uncharacterized glyoxalase superfamily protein PhnB